MQKKYWLFFAVSLFWVVSCGDTEIETGPYVEVGFGQETIEISLSVTSNGQVKVGGSYSHSFIKTKNMGGGFDAGWRVGVSKTIAEAKKVSYQLFIVYQDDSGVTYQDVYDIGKPFRVTFRDNQHVKIIETTSSGSIVVTVEVNSLSQTSSTNNSSNTSDIFCPGAVSPKLDVGEKAYVCTKNDRLIIRKNPGKNGSEITRIEPDTVVDVIGGPSCASGWNYWKVRLPSGTVGWAAEGGDSIDHRFLCIQ